MNTEQSLSDVTLLLSEMQRAGVNVDQACQWIARAIAIGKRAQLAVVWETMFSELSRLTGEFSLPRPVVQVHENIRA